ncbi:PTS sugar transporter subunit IIA [Candidatus Latescibacterota bacterium]
MDIIEMIKEKSCAPDLSPGSKDDCLKNLSRILSISADGFSEEELYKALLEREKLGSTGFEDGVAIPHAKVKGLDNFIISIAVSRKGIDFDSVDGKKSSLFFTVIGPDDNPQEHLKILAQISRVSRNANARKEIHHAPTPLAIKEAFVRYAGGLEPEKKRKEKNKLFIIILYEYRYFDDIIELFIEKGVEGANVIESAGIRNLLSNIPLFSDFLNFLGERSDVSKTIMTLVHESEISGLVEGIEEIIGDLDKHSGAMVMALDVSFMKGTLEI